MSDPDAPRSEEEKERLDRELLELVQELRVALTGVQILFAFLLTVPFTQRFSSVTDFQRYDYFVTLLCAAGAVALLIAPTAQHRILFRRHQKKRLLLFANSEAIAGLVFLALAMTGVVMLITDVIFKSRTVVAVTGPVALVYLGLWFLAPLARRVQRARREDSSTN